MAVQYIGNAYTLSNQNTGSTSITVPSGANYCIIGLHFWVNNTNTTCTLTLNDVTASAIELVPLDYNEESVYMYGVPIAESGSKTFTWSWTNSPDIGSGVGYTFMFFSGVDQSDPIRDSAYNHHPEGQGSTLTTPAINTSLSDLVAILTTDYSGSGSLVGYDQTVILSGTANGSKYNAGTKAGVSGTITATGAVVSGGIIAASLQGIVMNPAISDCTDPISDGESATVTGQYFSESGNKLEFGNSSTYSACTVLVEATITAESASEITATVDATGLDVGTVYAYVTNADSLTNETGFEVELTSSGIDCTIDAEITLNGTFPNTVGRLHGPVGGEIATSNTIDITTGRLSTIINTIVASNLIPTSVGRLHTDVGGEIGLSGGFTLSTRRGFNNGTMARLWRRR